MENLRVYAAIMVLAWALFGLYEARQAVIQEPTPAPTKGPGVCTNSGAITKQCVRMWHATLYVQGEEV